MLAPEDFRGVKFRAPHGMTAEQLYEGYRQLLSKLYDYGHYRRRAMELILRRGDLESKLVARGDVSVSYHNVQFVSRYGATAGSARAAPSDSNAVWLKA